jgi:diguanylate cyclase (GGDEF)-like protein
MNRQATVTTAQAIGLLTRPVQPARPARARPEVIGSPFLTSAQNKPMPPEPVSSLAIEDIEILLEAVRSRLRQTACTGLAMPEAGPLFGKVSKAQADVLDCVAALEQLHSALTRELARSRDLEMTVFDTRTALAQLRGELEGTLAGERQARHQALHDSLTSLPNRACFRDRLALAIARATTRPASLAVLYLDLDGFKAINDQHGHAVGDEVLKIIAARMSRAVRVGDTVARLGGDEFGCLLTAFRDREHLSRMATKLFNAIAAPLTLDRLMLEVRPSIGIALCPDHGSTPEHLLACADAAMYDAKRRQSGHAFGPAACTTSARANGAAANGAAANSA